MPYSPATRDLLWSLWCELGAPGDRHHQGQALDPEPLVVTTPALARDDAEILHHALNWCLAHGDWLSKTRLRALSKALPASASQEFAAFTGTLAAWGVAWKMPRALALDLTATEEPPALRLERPALVRLRLRGLVGVSTKADVLGALLASTGRWCTVRDLLVPGVSRISTERALNELHAATLVTRQGGQRNRRFRLRRAEELARVVGAAGVEWSGQAHALIMACQLHDLASRVGEVGALGRVVAARARERLLPLAQELGLEPPRVRERSDALEILLQWGELELERLSRS